MNDVKACGRKGRLWDSKAKKCGMKITERIEMIGGVEECHYNFDAMSLAVYYNIESDLSLIKIRIADAIDKAGVHRAVETINFYSMEDDN